MSKAAGTLITTYNDYFIPPRFMPGYKGHCPTIKFDYGETYGHSTGKYFQDYRSKTLESCRSVFNKGGYFPSYYTHQPDLVISSRTRSRDRYLSRPIYRPFNVDYDRMEQLRDFEMRKEAHREHYKDTVGTVPKVEYFQLPVPSNKQWKGYSSL